MDAEVFQTWFKPSSVSPLKLKIKKKTDKHDKYGRLTVCLDVVKLFFKSLLLLVFVRFRKKTVEQILEILILKFLANF